MRNWKKIVTVAIGIFLVLSASGLSCSKGTVENFETQGPTQAQLVLLKKAYDELYSFDYYDDKFEMEWEGALKERFGQLCQKEIRVTIEVQAEDYQFPEETLKRKRGDCTDFSNLFISVARNLGIPAQVVMGKVEAPEGVIGHAWAEIYYDGKWRAIDLRARANGKKIPFEWWLEGLISLKVREIDCRYNAEMFEGKTLIEIAKSSEEINKRGFFDNLSETFKKARGREPTEEESREFTEMAEDIERKCWEIIIKYIPEDPHSLIQVDSHQIKAWIDTLRDQAKG